MAGLTRRYPRPFDYNDSQVKLIARVGVYDVYTFNMSDRRGWLMLQGPDRPELGSINRRRPRELELRREGDTCRWEIESTFFGNNSHAGPIEEDRKALHILNTSLNLATPSGDALERLK